MIAVLTSWPSFLLIISRREGSTVSSTLLIAREVMGAVVLMGNVVEVGWKVLRTIWMWREWMLAHLACAVEADAGAVATDLSTSWWATHRKGSTTLRMGVVDGVPEGFEVLKAAAATTTAKNVAAEVGFARVRIAIAIGGSGCHGTGVESRCHIRIPCCLNLL